MLRGEGESHTGTEARAQKHGLAGGEVLGQNSSPALKQLGPMTGPSRAIGPLLFSANSGHIPARLSDSVMRVKRQLKQHDYLYTVQAEPPFSSRSGAVCPWHSRGARVGGGVSRPKNVSAYTTRAQTAYHRPDTMLLNTRPNAVIMQPELLPSLTGFADCGASWSKVS